MTFDEQTARAEQQRQCETDERIITLATLIDRISDLPEEPFLLIKSPASDELATEPIGAGICAGKSPKPAGAEERCLVLADDPLLSRSHFRVFRDGDSYFLEDLGSTNGTCVNSSTEPVRGRHRLNSGDCIRASDHLFIFARP